ncbi:MAG: 50S ribosomal protein L17 [Lentisphaerae bacterium ADurb.BinA184]|nr:MAG: 50S ribosomal protein L17 [Lentisphaerae bacterium ADurb.BinA184]
MRHRKYTFKIGRSSSHRRAMMANMVCSLLVEGQVKTGLVRGKEMRRRAERMITLGKQGTLAARRRAVAILHQRPVVKRLFDEIAPRYAGRQGGYTRIIRLAPRVGDACDMCLVQLVTEPVGGTGETAPAETPAATTTEPKAGKKATK